MRYTIALLGIALIFLIIMLVTNGCATSMTTMAECKKICRGSVQHYQDDTIECGCKEENKK